MGNKPRRSGKHAGKSGQQVEDQGDVGGKRHSWKAGGNKPNKIRRHVGGDWETSRGREGAK